ncbi:MAG: hypothetical protein B6D56_03545 [Candidatus Omnitrophica bacterium 4484_70.1]|nr:MAG: hypothetical protein B6D56_03545 [Candidatus Omnitrophica bacterium 4484_70.1]
MIKVISLSKKFNSQWVIRNLNLNIKKGEFYCLLGPNGAGKTTTLKILSGLIKPTQGKVYLGGFDVEREYLQAKKLLGFIPDTPFLYENLTPWEFLEFIANIFGIEKNTFQKEVNYYLELFNLKEVKDTLLKEFSHGMKQRVLYIANFIRHPKVLLIDEPLVGLDPHAIYLIKDLLKKETQQGTTILMCTHILSIAEELSHRIGILDKGEIIVQGTLDELKRRMGDTNLEEIFLKLTETGE